ncbi:MAG TPA: FadD3 family acyl-CoA ligase [Acidimicrobiales bacterium]|nr:FadD3 family acyl-CoA ligase [Acidimicrobiales bacterium]
MDTPPAAAPTTAGPSDWDDWIAWAHEVQDPRADLRWGTVPAMLADVARRRPGAEAVADGPIRLIYGELAEAAGTLSRALMASGVAKGDRVAIWAPNCAQWVVGALGAMGAGAIVVTLNTRFKGGEAAYILRASGARVLLTVQGFLGVDYPAMLDGQDVGHLAEVVVVRREGDAAGVGSVTAGPAEDGTTGPREIPVRGLDDYLERAASVPPDAAAARAASVQPDDVSDLLFTSGTTGHPKGVMSIQSTTLREYGTWAALAGLRAGDRYLLVNPLFHTFGYKAGMLASLMYGATIVPEPVFDVDRVLDRIAAERITVLPGPPTLFRGLLAHPDRAAHDLSSLRLATTGADIIPVELVVAMREELGFTTVLTAYGLTESCGTVTMCRRSDPPEVVARTSGRALPDVEVRIADGDGKELPAGEAGEILVRGYVVMRGYWEDPEATAQAVDRDGWLHTGDVGVMDDAGNVAITDRLKDMFVTGGFNAYPAEIEGILRGCPGVGPLAVVGVADDRMGEVGCVYLAYQGDDPAGYADRVLSWSREAMANYKVPRYAVVVDALPANAIGKIVKGELRRRFVGGVDKAVTYERRR